MAEPPGGYAAFALRWSTPVDHQSIAQRQHSPVVTWLGQVTILLQVGGYLLQWQRTHQPVWNFLIPGDAGFSADLCAIRHRLGPVNFLALPIGAYLPLAFMKPMHVNPADAVQIMLDLEAKPSMAVHWAPSC